jgi:hypothetical protein
MNDDLDNIYVEIEVPEPEPIKITKYKEMSYLEHMFTSIPPIKIQGGYGGTSYYTSDSVSSGNFFFKNFDIKAMGIDEDSNHMAEEVNRRHERYVQGVFGVPKCKEPNSDRGGE